MKFTASFFLAAVVFSGHFGFADLLPISGPNTSGPKISCASTLDPERAGTTEEFYLRETAMKKAKVITDLQEKLDWWGKKTGGFERSTAEAMRNDLEELRERLRTGEENKAIDQYRNLWAEFESHALRALDNEVLIARFEASKNDLSLSAHDADSMIRKLRKEVAEDEKFIARNDGEYKMSRKLLETIIAGNPHITVQDLLRGNSIALPTLEPKIITVLKGPQAGRILPVQEVAFRVYRTLGVHNMSAMKDLSPLRIPTERISLDDINHLFRDSTVPIIQKLKQDLKSERILYLKLVLMSIPEALQLRKALVVLPAQVLIPGTQVALPLRQIISSLLLLDLDDYARRKFLPIAAHVIQIATNDDTEIGTFEALKTLMKADTEVRSNDLLTTMARLLEVTLPADTESSPIWNRLKNMAQTVAKKGTGNKTFQDFHDRMNAVESDATQLGNLSRFSRDTPAIRHGLFISAGIGGGLFYSYYTKHQAFSALVHWVSVMYQHVASQAGPLIEQAQKHLHP